MNHQNGKVMCNVFSWWIIARSLNSRSKKFDAKETELLACRVLAEVASKLTCDNHGSSLNNVIHLVRLFAYESPPPPSRRNSCPNTVTSSEKQLPSWCWLLQNPIETVQKRLHLKPTLDRTQHLFCSLASVARCYFLANYYQRAALKLGVLTGCEEFE